MHYRFCEHVQKRANDLLHQFLLHNAMHSADLGSPNGGVKCRGYETIVIFDQHLALSRI